MVLGKRRVNLFSLELEINSGPGETKSANSGQQSAQDRGDRVSGKRADQSDRYTSYHQGDESDVGNHLRLFKPSRRH